MITLAATNETLEIATTAALSTDYYFVWADNTTTAFTPGVSSGNIASATTTTVVAAPAASTQRQIKYGAIRNRSSSAQTVTVKFDVAATERILTPDTVLQSGETLEYSSGRGWRVLTTSGAEKAAIPIVTGVTARTIPILQVGTATEAAGVWYSHAKDSGTPGAWSTGSPGVAGRATDGTTTADDGCLKFPNAASGANYLTAYTCNSGVTGTQRVHDVLWVNTALVVTTTTAQTVNSVAFGARDLNGTANGAGVQVGILVTAATTNAGAVTNTTMSYTDQDGNAGATATMASFPATAVIGTIVWFQLAAGDSGVRSIQTVTLGTSYAAGSISLIACVPIAECNTTTANVGCEAPIDKNTGVRLYNGACLLVAAVQSATTAATRMGTVTVTTR